MSITEVHTCTHEHTLEHRTVLNIQDLNKTKVIPVYLASYKSRFYVRSIWLEKYY